MPENKRMKALETFMPLQVNYLLQVDIEPSLVGNDSTDETIRIICNGIGLYQVDEDTTAIAFIDPVSGELTHALADNPLYTIVSILDVWNYMPSS